MWDRQKRWELKREVLFEIAKKTATSKDTLTALHAFYQTEKQSAAKGLPACTDTKVSVGQAWIDAASDFDNATLLVGLVCSEEVLKAAREFSAFTRDVGMKVTGGQPDFFQESINEFVAKMNAVTRAVRKALED